MRRLAVAIAVSSVFTLGASERLVEGTAGSQVRVLIYEDLQCPDCADFRKVLDEKLLPKYHSQVAFEHRDFPLAKHAWARKAAIAARFVAATKPDLAVAFRQYLMSHQEEINADNFNGVLDRYARAHGMDPAQAIAALDDKQLAAAVQRDFEEGVARGIAHTPTVLVNGIPFVEQFTYEEVAKAIDSELAALK
jgi:protein-disulfide isomerase